MYYCYYFSDVMPSSVTSGFHSPRLSKPPLLHRCRLRSFFLSCFLSLCSLMTSLRFHSSVFRFCLDVWEIPQWLTCGLRCLRECRGEPVAFLVLSAVESELHMGRVRSAGKAFTGDSASSPPKETCHQAA